MDATQREAISRMVARAAGISEDSAKETVEDFMPQFIAEYTDRPRYFKMDSQKMGTLMNQLQQKYNLDLNQDYMARYINNRVMFNNEYHGFQKMISAEKQDRKLTLGNELQRVLSVYTGANDIKTIGDKYSSHNWHLNVAKKLEKDPNNRHLQAKQKQFHHYFEGVVRANQLLKYLNNRRVNMRIDVDDHDPTKLVAFLPEHGNMKVTLMADDPKEIGTVNTWNNIIGFSKREADKADLKDLPPEAIVDTLLNPRAELDVVDPFDSKAGKHFTNVQRKGLKVPMFVTALDKHSRSMKSLADAVKKQEDFDASEDDFKDEDGSSDEADQNKITNEDKSKELLSRNKQDFKEINTPEAIKYEHEHHGLYTTIKNQATALGLHDVRVFKNSKGVYKYEFETKNPSTGRLMPGHGIIGGYIEPEADGSNKLMINGKLKGYSVPGMRGYINTDTGQLNVKPFSQIMRERVRSIIADQVFNPELRDSASAYGALDNLYTTDSYSTIIDKGVNSPDYEKTLVKTLLRRVRLGNEVVSAGNAYNEDEQHVANNKKQMAKFALTKSNKRRDMMMTRDLRTIPEEWQNVVDNEMTGIGKTMGASLFLGDDVKINPDGSLIPTHPDQKAKSPLHRLPLFDYDKYDPADRNIMAFNQAIRNVPIDKVNVAMMTMSGYTENDAAVVTAKYAQNHKIKGSNGKMRPLMRGDKISDLHGNKSTISEVIDPNEKDPERRKKLAREIAIVKANPDLDVIVNPYSSISRLNTGSIHEIQAGETKQLNSPKEYPDIDLSKVTMGKENYVVCVGQRVDEKTQVYDDEAFANGRARRFSHQLAAGAASAGLPKTLSYVYKNTTEKGWPKFFDDLHVLGFDIDKDHHLGYMDYNRDDAVHMKMPTKEEAEANAKLPKRERNKLAQTAFNKSFMDALRQSGGKKPIMMDLPTSYKNAAGNVTNTVVVPYEQIRADYELAKKIGATPDKIQSSFHNTLKNIYNAAAGLKLDSQIERDANGKPVLTPQKHYKRIDVYNPNKAAALTSVLSKQILAKDFGQHKNVIKNEIYSAPMPNSATLVVTPDPNLDIDTIAVGPKAYDNLHLKNPNESVVFWRDPILRDGGFRFVHVKKDNTLTGAALNPVIVKSMDMDFDGDTAGMVPIHDPEVQKELEKQRPSRNLINPATKNPETYLETGLELQGSLYRQGDHDAQAKFNDPNVTPETVRALVKKGFNSDKAYGIGIDMRSKDSYLKSLEDLIKSGAKGHFEKDKHGQPILDKNGHILSKALRQAEHYYDGERTPQDMHESMVGLAVKADGVGPAGKLQQKLLWPGRNYDAKDLMDFTYLATQSTLQAKHDGKEAKRRLHAVLGPMPNLIAGFRPDATTKEKVQQQTITPAAFDNQVEDLYNSGTNNLGLNVNPKTVHGVSKMLTNKDGYLMTNKERLNLADPLDVLAYKGGDAVVNLQKAMDMDKPIATGRYTKCFEMPESFCSERVLGRYYGNDDKAKEQKSVESIKLAEPPMQPSMQPKEPDHSTFDDPTNF